MRRIMPFDVLSCDATLDFFIRYTLFLCIRGNSRSHDIFIILLIYLYLIFSGLLERSRFGMPEELRLLEASNKNKRGVFRVHPLSC